ncbi:hypothetical protein V8C26DRAFT_411161 [Trichoderma gracile]
MVMVALGGASLLLVLLIECFLICTPPHARQTTRRRLTSNSGLAKRTVAFGDANSKASAAIAPCSSWGRSKWAFSAS